MLRRIAVLAFGLTCIVSVGCTDPNSPVDPTHQPTRGEVRQRDANVYAGGAIIFYYLRIATSYGTYWVDENWEDWVTCRPGDQWARALGCL